MSDDNWVDEARALVAAGKKIDAIKLVQRSGGCGLVEAKAHVDNDFEGMDGSQPPYPAMPPIETVHSDDWRGETAIGAHLTFAQPLDEEQLRAIAAFWKGWPLASRGSRLPYRPGTHPYSCWRFHDDFAEVVFEPELPDDDALDPVYPSYAAEELAKELHRLAPLRAARVFAGSLECPVSEARRNPVFEAALE